MTTHSEFDIQQLDTQELIDLTRGIERLWPIALHICGNHVFNMPPFMMALSDVATQAHAILTSRADKTPPIEAGICGDLPGAADCRAMVIQSKTVDVARHVVIATPTGEGAIISPAFIDSARLTGYLFYAHCKAELLSAGHIIDESQLPEWIIE